MRAPEEAGSNDGVPIAKAPYSRPSRTLVRARIPAAGEGNGRLKPLKPALLGLAQHIANDAEGIARRLLEGEGESQANDQIRISLSDGTVFGIQLLCSGGARPNSTSDSDSDGEPAAAVHRTEAPAASPKPPTAAAKSKFSKFADSDDDEGAPEGGNDEQPPQPTFDLLEDSAPVHRRSASVSSADSRSEHKERMRRQGTAMAQRIIAPMVGWGEGEAPPENPIECPFDVSVKGFAGGRVAASRADVKQLKQKAKETGEVADGAPISSNAMFNARVTIHKICSEFSDMARRKIKNDDPVSKLIMLGQKLNFVQLEPPKFEFFEVEGSVKNRNEFKSHASMIVPNPHTGKYMLVGTNKGELPSEQFLSKQNAKADAAVRLLSEIYSIWVKE